VKHMTSPESILGMNSVGNNDTTTQLNKKKGGGRLNANVS
jgi:hypothetical protein